MKKTILITCLLFLLIFSYTIIAYDTFDNCPCNIKKDNCSKTIKEIEEEKGQDKDGKGQPCYYCSDSDEIHINVVYDGDVSTDNNWDFNYLCSGEAGWKGNTFNYCSVFTWVNYDDGLGYRIGRTFYVWDTCGIPDNAIITNVTFYVSYCEDNVDADEYLIVVNSSIDITDFDNLALYYHMIDKNTPISEPYQFLAQYNNEIRITNFDWINKEGFSQFVVIDYAYDYSCVAPYRTGNYQNINFADEHINNCYRPYLIVSYELPAGNCSGVYWYNYTDNNITINTSFDKNTDNFIQDYTINENNWFNLAGTLLFDNSQLFLFISLSLWIYFITKYYDTKRYLFAIVQLGLCFPLLIIIAWISLNFVFGYVIVLMIPAISIYILVDATFKKK